MARVIWQSIQSVRSHEPTNSNTRARSFDFRRMASRRVVMKMFFSTVSPRSHCAVTKEITAVMSFFNIWGASHGLYAYPVLLDIRSSGRHGRVARGLMSSAVPHEKRRRHRVCSPSS